MPWIAVFILVYCLWNSKDTFRYWQEHFFTDVSFLCFLIWCIPLLFQRSYPHPIPLFLALGFTFFGNLGEIHILQDLALGFAIGSFYPFSWLSLLWMISALSWAPAFAWVATQITAHIQPLRLLIVIIPVLGLIGKSLYLRKEA